MNKRRISTRVLLYFVMLMLLMVAGCSGGGDDSAPAAATKKISGVAAAGAPIIGTVTVKDSTTPTPIDRVTTIAADGSYSVDVSGMKAPFALRADGNVGGREYHLYSAALSADINGTINITPFTDLIIANMALQIAEEYYTSGAFSSMTSGELATAEAALQAKLQPILTAMGLGTSIDLLRTSFNADHTGLDRVIDVVKVTIDPDTVKATLTDVLNEETITVNIGNGGTGTGTFTPPAAESLSDFDAIVKVWSDFSAFFATSLPNPNNAAFRALFDEDTFLDNGRNLDTSLVVMTTDSSMIGISITNLVLLSMDKAAGTAEVTFTVVQNGQITDGPSGSVRMIKKNGKWRYAGNGWIAEIYVGAWAQYFPSEGGSGTHIYSGLNLSIVANQPPGALVKSAVVTGPGLPPGGVILNRQDAYEWFTIPGLESNLYSPTNAAIEAIPDNAKYTFALKNALDGGGSVLATYTFTLPKRPLMSTELSSASFPAITAPTDAAFWAYTGGNLTVSWNLPAGLSSRWLDLQVAGSTWTPTVGVSVQLNSADRSKMLTIPLADISFTVAGRRLWLAAKDIYQRRFETHIALIE